MRLISLSDHIDFQEAIRLALAEGWSSYMETIAVSVSKDQMDAAEYALSRLQQLGTVIVKGRAIHSFKRADGGVFMVRLEVLV